MPRFIVLLASLLAAASPALAQPPAVPPAAPAATVIPAGTPVVIRLDVALDSQIARPGDQVRISLAEPFMAQGKVLLPAGTPGMAQIIHVDAAGSGQAGELYLQLR